MASPPSQSDQCASRRPWTRIWYTSGGASCPSVMSDIGEAILPSVVPTNDGLWRPHVERSLRPNLMKKGFLSRDGESAGFADAADDLPVARPELFAGLLVGHVDMTRRVHAHRQRRAPETLQGPQEQL